jgi:hypothetical protein
MATEILCVGPMRFLLDPVDPPRVECGGQGTFDNGLWWRTDTEDHCHCGSHYNGSDHCPSCGCEQYESLACPGRMED